MKIYIPIFLSDENAFNIRMHESFTNELEFLWVIQPASQIIVLWICTNETLLWLQNGCIISLYVSMVMGSCSPHGSDLTAPLCFRLEYPFALSKLPLLGWPLICSHPVSWYQHTISAYTKYLRVLDTFLRIWVEEESFPVQYSEHIPSIPVHTEPSKLSSQPCQSGVSGHILF